MSLLSDQDRQTVATHLSAVTHPVTILLFTQTFGAPDSVRAARQVLDEIVPLNAHLSIEEVNLILERDRAAQYGIDQVPGIALLRGGEDTGIRFLGAPSGYEFMSLLEAVVLAGTDDSGLTQASKDLIAAQVTGPMTIDVFVTPTCPHCPRAVTLAHRMAAESPHIRATCIEATEFLDLSRQYRVTGVPKTIVNGTIEIMGAVPEDVFVTTAVGGVPGAD